MIVDNDDPRLKTQWTEDHRKFLESSTIIPIDVEQAMLKLMESLEASDIYISQREAESVMVFVQCGLEVLNTQPQSIISMQMSLGTLLAGIMSHVPTSGALLGLAGVLRNAHDCYLEASSILMNSEMTESMVNTKQ